MHKNRHRNAKSVRALVLALLFAAAFCLVPQQVMADGYSATVTLGKAEGLANGTEFEFELYKVGHYNGPGFELEDVLKGAHVKLDYDKEDAEGWLSSAWTLSEYIDSNGIELDAIGGKHMLKPGESFSVNGLEDGLYLVKSKTARDSSDKFVHWTPQPVYVAILGKDSSVAINNNVVIKIVKTVTTLRHRVTKVWEIKSGSEKTAKPSEINVNIRYGNKIIDTVKLTPDNNWTFEWKSEESGDKYKYISDDLILEFAPANKDHKWTVDEIFTVKGFKEAYGRNPDEDEKEALEKIANSFTAEIMPDKVEDAETDDPVALDQKVTQHRIKNTYKEKTPPPPSVKTGDENHIVAWAGLMAAAALLLIVLFVRRKSSEK